MFKVKRNTSGISLLKRRAWFDESGISTTSEATQGEAAVEHVSSVPSIDWTKTQIPEDAIKNSPAYKALLAESVERRQEIKKLKDAQAAPAQDASAQTPAPTQTVVTEEMINKIVAQELGKVQLKAQQDNLLSQFKVPVEEQDTWRDSNVEAMTKRLQKAFGSPLNNANAGNGSGNADPYADMKVRIKAAVMGTGENPGANLYTPETMTRVGGGIVRNN